MELPYKRERWGVNQTSTCTILAGLNKFKVFVPDFAVIE